MPARRIEVGICTYRRPAVVEAMASLAAQDLPQDIRMRVVVADNDEAPEARDRVLAAAAGLGLDVAYVHAPARNISLARNACLDAARGEFIAFLDDDETASPGWLSALVREADRGGWDAVLGPVQAVYGSAAPRWLVEADMHSTSATYSGDRILKGYAGNVLIRRGVPAAQGLHFDLALGRAGGEDDDFFYRLTDAGGSIGYAPDALAYEPVPEGRQSLTWLLRRSFRTGQTHGARLNRIHSGASRWPQLAIAAAKCAVCLAGAAANAASTAGRSRWILRGALHAGAAARLAGVKELQLY